MNVARPLGNSLGLGILVAIFASATAADCKGTDTLAYRVGISLSAAPAMLALAVALLSFERGPSYQLGGAWQLSCLNQHYVSDGLVRYDRQGKT